MSYNVQLCQGASWISIYHAIKWTNLMLLSHLIKLFTTFSSVFKLFIKMLNPCEICDEQYKQTPDIPLYLDLTIFSRNCNKYLLMMHKSIGQCFLNFSNQFVCHLFLQNRITYSKVLDRYSINEINKLLSMVLLTEISTMEH